MINLRILLIPLLSLVVLVTTKAQCSFNLGPDTIICAGTNLTLNSLPGMDSYSWNTGPSSQSITVNSTGTYICDVSLLLSGNNLVINGDFSSGNTGFTSDYTHNAGGIFGPVSLGGTYFVTPDPSLAHSNYTPCGDHTTGTGNMMVTNGDTLPGDNMWCQTIPVNANTNYQAGFWLASVIPVSPAQLQISMNGVPLGNALTASLVVCDWTEFSDTWNSGAATSVTICIENLNTQDGGNDYAIDDVYLYEYCEFSDTIDVTVQAIPTPNLGPDQQICPWDSLTLDVTTPGASYLWSTLETTPSISVNPPPTAYSVQVTVNGCTGTDAINITEHNIANLDLGPDTVLCAGTPLVLGSNITGATYLWNTGPISAAIPITASGTYWLNATSFGCSQRDSIDVTFTPNPVVSLGPDPNICVYDSVLLDATTPNASYLWSNGVTTGTQWGLPDSSYSVTVTVNGCTGTDTVNVGSIPNPVVNLGIDTTICPWDSVLLGTQLPAGNYLWNTGETSQTIYASNQGVYWVEVSVNGCSAIDSVELFYQTYPGVNIGPDVAICPGDSVTFSNGFSSTSYAWSNGSNGINYTHATPGWVWLDATTNGCTFRDSAFVSLLPIPAVDIGVDTIICADQQFTLSAQQAGATYLWNTGATNPTITALPDSTYSVLVTVGGCIGGDTINIGAYPLPTVNLGADTAICPSSTITLDANVMGGTYTWQDGSNASTYTATPTGVFDVLVSDANGCEATDTISVSAAPIPAVQLGPDVVICPGDSVLFDATSLNVSYAWSNGETTAAIWALAAGDYSVDVNLNGCINSDTVNVSFAATPAINLGNDTTLCPGESVVLDASNPTAIAYQWQNAAVTSTLNVTAAGQYSVTVTDAQNCTGSDTINVNYVNTGSLDLGNDTTICPGSQVTFDANIGNGFYQWSNNVFTPTNTVSQPDTFSVVVSLNGCNVSDTVVLSNFQVPTIDLGLDTTICPNDAVLLDATVPGATYLWSNGANTPTINAAPTGFYSVTVIDANGCFSGDFININPIPLNAVNLGPDQTICAGDSVLLDGTTLNASSYLWNTTDTLSSIYVQITGTYILSVNQGGCSLNDTINVTVVPFPQVNLGPDQTLCPGDSAQLDATWPGAAYLWNTGDTTASIYAASAGNYSVDVSVNSCLAQDTVQISYANPFSIDLGNDTTLCPGETLNLSVNLPGSSNIWNGLNPGNSFLVTSAGTYWVSTTIGNCSQSDSIVVNYVNAGTFSLGPDTSICSGDSLLLDASGIVGGTYQWQDGSSATSYTATNTGLYTLMVNVGACTLSDSMLLQVNPYPAFNLGNDTSLCAGDSLLLSVAGVLGTVSWWNAAATSSQYVQGGGTYWASMNNLGCISVDTINVSAGPLPPVALGNDTLLCAGASISLTGPVGMSTYMWNDASTNDSLLVQSAGTYYLTSTLNGCTGSDTIVISYLQPGAVNLGPDVTLCPNDSLILTSGLAGASYLWNTGATADSIVATTGGLYAVTATLNGCAESDTMNLTIEPIAFPQLFADSTICEGDSITISVQANGASILWNTASTADSIVVSQTGTYSVELSQNGCLTQDSVQISVQNFLDTVYVGDDFMTCAGTPLLIDAFTPGSDYLWSNGATTSSTTFDSATEGWVQLSGFCIAASDTFQVNTEDCTPLVYIPNTFTPDGDGINDVFAWPWWGDLTQIEVLIYNRWGALIFESADPYGFWDGTYKGAAVQDGVYAYRILYKGFNAAGVVQEELRGHVNVLR